jgi:hypothetical protein
VNCRTVEDSVFPHKEVADVLESGFVEARLHMDMTPAMKNYAKFNARVNEVRDKYAGVGNIGLPRYYVLDPNKLDTPLATRSGKASRAVFREFFTKAQERARAGG